MLTHQPLVAVAVLLLLFAAPWLATADTLVVENRSSNHKKARITCFHKFSHRKPFYVNKIAPKEVAKVPIPKNLTQAFCLGLYDSKLVKLYDSKQDHERCENTCSIRLLNTGYNLWNDKIKKWEVIASSKSHAASPKLSPFGSPAKLTSMKKSHAKSPKLSPHAASPKLSPSRSSTKLISTKKSHTKSPELSSHAASPKLSHSGSPAKSRSTKKSHAKSPKLSPVKSPIKHHVIPN